ncbi:MAG: LysR family transcriptional regulator [Paracoccaceae bacterium]|nr:MAG: LysR family transcriptional regulator [Paracoccaceae bacterium]
MKPAARDAAGLPDLHALHVAAVVMEMGGMSAAAARLGVTQSAVSQAVKRAEAQIGAALLHRDQRPITPTEAGRRLAAHMAEIRQKVARAIEDMRTVAGRPERHDLRLGMVDSFASTVGPTLIRALMAAALAGRVTAHSGLSQAQLDALRQHRIDAAVTSDAPDRNDDLSGIALYREPFLMVAPRAQADRLRGLALRDILRVNPLIRYGSPSHMGRQIEEHLRRLGIAHPRHLAFDTSDALVAMVAGGVGVAITTPLCLRQAAVHLPHIAILPMPGPGFSRTLTLMTRRCDGQGISRRIAEAARGIIARCTMPQLVAEVPWLAPDLARMLPDWPDTDAAPCETDPAA